MTKTHSYYYFWAVLDDFVAIVLILTQFYQKEKHNNSPNEFLF